MAPRFDIEFLHDAIRFLEDLDPRITGKIIYNIDKSRYIRDVKLFKKLDNDIWEFRTRYSGRSFRIFAFWEKGFKKRPKVILTHGIIKKDMKIQKSEIDKANTIRDNYERNK